MVVNGDFINSVSKKNLEQRIETSETVNNSFENKTPLLLPRI